MPGPLTLALAIVGVVLAARDPRRLAPGILLTLAVTSLVTALASSLVTTLGDVGAVLGVDDQARLLGQAALLVGIPVLSGLVLGSALVVNGVLMLLRERRSPAHLLSLLAGVAILALYALGWLTIAAELGGVVVLVLVLAAPIGYLGLVLLAYLLWSLVYARIAARAPVAAAVVVLGAGLVDGRVSPLLAARVARGVALADEDPRTLLVLSGGQGADEPRSEASAMAEHAESLGVARDRLLLEEASTTTEENLQRTRALLEERGVLGPVTVVTSDYHAFRAATLLRTLGIRGHARGARTARYYLPSALLREYVALLRDHLRVHAAIVGVLLVPFAALLVLTVLRVVGA
ncbi:YdcF family protein [Agrococcus jejuensis]|uniref:YdcF family protein n=1 Tax=Agrococcus jejuensis TaxID=399736 RepID=UPI00119ED6F5|nr:YdcF family protein [Agrococcus jejuensis]